MSLRLKRKCYAVGRGLWNWANIPFKCINLDNLGLAQLEIYGNHLQLVSIAVAHSVHRERRYWLETKVKANIKMEMK